jgi:glyoxylase I family protein
MGGRFRGHNTQFAAIALAGHKTTDRLRSPAPAGEYKMIQTTGLTPLLQVFDMNEALAFYMDALGFERIADSGVRDTPEGRFAHWCLLRLGGAELMLNTAYDEGERPPARDPARQAAHGDTCLYFACPDPDAAAAELRAGLSRSC